MDRRTVIVMDIKTPGSGECARNLPANLSVLSKRDQVKFVLCDRRDYEWAREMIERHQLSRRVGEVLLSPSYGQLSARRIADWDAGKINCRRACKCSCTRCCGATSPDTEEETWHTVRAPWRCCLADWIRPPPWPWPWMLAIAAMR